MGRKGRQVAGATIGGAAGAGAVTRAEVDAVVAEGRLTEDMWDLDKVSSFLGIPKGTLYQWRSTGRGPRSYKPGNALLYDPFEVRAYLIATMTEPTA
jgi:hypothetical protein